VAPISVYLSLPHRGGEIDSLNPGGKKSESRSEFVSTSGEYWSG